MLPDKSEDVVRFVGSKDAACSLFSADEVDPDVCDNDVATFALIEELRLVAAMSNVLPESTDDAVYLVTSGDSVLIDISDSAVKLTAVNDASLPNTSVDAFSSVNPDNWAVFVGLNDFIPSKTRGDSLSLVAFGNKIIVVVPGDAAPIDILADFLPSVDDDNAVFFGVTGDSISLVAPNNCVLLEMVDNSAPSVAYNVVLLSVLLIDTVLFVDCGSSLTSSDTIFSLIRDNALLCVMYGKNVLSDESNDVDASVPTEGAVCPMLIVDAVFSSISGKYVVTVE